MKKKLLGGIGAGLVTAGLGLALLTTYYPQNTHSVDANTISTDINPAIHITSIHARTSVPGSLNSAAYMTIKNQGSGLLSLMSATSPIAKKTELHRAFIENGSMKMRPIENIAIPPGNETVLSPGGYHIMLMGLAQPITEGMQVPIELLFSDGSKAFLNVLATQP